MCSMAGPLVDANIDDIVTVKNSKRLKVREIGEVGAAPLMLMAAGRLSTFRAVRAPALIEDGGVKLDAASAETLGVEQGGDNPRMSLPVLCSGNWAAMVMRVNAR